MLLYDVPREIRIEDVHSVVAKNYPSSTPFEKVQYTYWVHISECLSAGGQLCPTLNSFLKYVKVTDYLYAISTLLITVTDVGKKEDCLKVVWDYYNNERKVRRIVHDNVIHVDFGNRGGI